MVRPLREILGPVGLWEAVVEVVLGCAVLGLIGDPHHREMESVGVGVRGRCFFSVSADTRGAVGVEGCSTRGVDIGVTDARRACE